MRIVRVEPFICFARWRNWVFVEVETEDGLVGLGEATLEGRELTIVGHLRDLERYLVGKDARDINAHARALKRDPFWVSGYVAQTGIAAVEMALLDLLGKSLRVPVWQLLGGRVRRAARVYANGWYFGATTPEEWAERAAEVVALGFTAMKFDPFGRSGPQLERSELEEACALVAAVRATVGPRVDLLIEGHGRFDHPSAVRAAAALSQYDCTWFEEPLTPGNPQSLARLAQSIPIQVAVGERCYSMGEYREILDLGAASFLQPDVIHAGGIVELRHIAALAEMWQVPLAPHNPNGPVATAATLTVDAVIPNFFIQEMLAPWDVPWRDEVVIGGPKVVDGYLEITDAPGLGVELDHAALAAHPYAPVDPSFFDGSSVLETVDLRGVVE